VLRPIMTAFGVFVALALAVRAAHAAPLAMVDCA
jgi:hypothetical protein